MPGEAGLVRMMAWSSLVGLLSGGAVTCVVLWMGRSLAHRIGLVDHPDTRKVHIGDKPLIGGAGMFLGLLVAFFLLDLDIPELHHLRLAIAILVLVGVLDDYLNLSVALRFVVHITVAVIMAWWGGVGIYYLGDLFALGPIYLGNWMVIFTVICVVGVINAVNMADGLDGLGGGLGLVTFTLIVLLSLEAGLWNVAVLAAAFIVVLLPFLGFNVRWFGRPASLFMGNAGSTFLGFSLAWFMVYLTQGDHHVLRPVTAIWLIAVPLIDMFSVLLRRILQKRPPFAPDRKHFHHLLLHLGWSVNRTMLFLTGLSLLCGVVGILGERLNIPEYVMFAGILMVFFGYFWGSTRLWSVAPAHSGSAEAIEPKVGV
ncbi:MAG: undecaprenyl-phosphate alpha-N-acetylglucosaminyl 1-phosphate transferase [Magnetococcales bacterium]|nr:undecaprenyl-phosphate alpha-N-acetylglucosaminyl 1-phosphate transferase [Magnetococcales bacterium]MBF0322132.1 undecaprenyl-phosphate alpha-N-acetylglucosaminyl 1-phosphate transferase [Magnetococcales bacterium]